MQLQLRLGGSCPTAGKLHLDKMKQNKNIVKGLPGRSMLFDF